MGPKPLWVWRYQQKAHCLRSLYPGFRHMEPGYISSDAYVELHSMDFGTGHTDPSFTQFFAPDTDTQIRIDNTTLNPEDPLDDPFTWARMTKENDDTFGSDDMHHSLHAAFSKYIRKSPHGNKPLLWDPVPMTEDNTLFNSNDHHGFSIESIATCADSKASHQIVIMKEDRCYHESLPSAGELFVLLQWILGGIETNRYYMSKHRRHERPHHDFPTMVISFLPDARVRILNGYFDRGRLQVAYTPAMDFDTEDYADKMDTLLQWAWPLVYGDTSKPVPLPTIEDDEEDEWDEWEKWELKYREENEDEDVDDSGSEPHEDDTSTEDDDSSSDWDSECEEDESDEEDNLSIADISDQDL